VCRHLIRPSHVPDVQAQALSEGRTLPAQACQNAVSREDSQQAVASDELCAALMDEYVEWLSVLGKEALPEAKSIDWAVKAEEHRQLKVCRSPPARPGSPANLRADTFFH